VLAKVSEATVRNFEIGRRRTGTNNLDAISNALESAGIEFLDECGVNLRSSTSNRAGKMPTDSFPVSPIASDLRLEELVPCAA
jgi:hypothetical protein